jgi:hypothetical protein
VSFSDVKALPENIEKLSSASEVLLPFFACSFTPSSLIFVSGMD